MNKLAFLEGYMSKQSAPEVFDIRGQKAVNPVADARKATLDREAFYNNEEAKRTASLATSPEKMNLTADTFRRTPYDKAQRDKTTAAMAKKPGMEGFAGKYVAPIANTLEDTVGDNVIAPVAAATGNAVGGTYNALASLFGKTKK